MLSKSTSQVPSRSAAQFAILATCNLPQLKVLSKKILGCPRPRPCPCSQGVGVPLCRWSFWFVALVVAKAGLRFCLLQCMAEVRVSSLHLPCSFFTPSLGFLGFRSGICITIHSHRFAVFRTWVWVPKSFLQAFLLGATSAWKVRKGEFLSDRVLGLRYLSFVVFWKAWWSSVLMRHFFSPRKLLAWSECDSSSKIVRHSCHNLVTVDLE